MVNRFDECKEHGAMREMHEIEAKFNAYFKAWDIVLPPEDIAQRRRGKIVRAGWAIWYLFDTDAKGDYLDFYATHRMTDDRHVRIYATGEVDDSLPRIESVRRGSPDPEENRRLQSEFDARNQAVAERLAAKGFGLQGDEPLSVQMNRRLRTRGDGQNRQDEG